MSSLAVCGINSPFGELSPTSRQIAHVLRTRPPLDFIGIATNEVPFDLHVLSTPPAFVLSQNQTLRRKFYPSSLKGRKFPASSFPQAVVTARGTICVKLRLRKSTKNAQFSSCCFVYDPSGFRMLVRNRTCAVKDLMPVAASRGESTLVASDLSRKPTWGRQHHPAHVRVLAWADWRRTVPTWIPKHRPGQRTLDERVPQSTPSFTFLKKIFAPSHTPDPTPPLHGNKKPAEP